MGCPDANTVQALLEGQLGEREREEILAHAADCADCRGLVGALLSPALGTEVADTLAEGPVAREPRAGSRVGRFVIEEKLGGGAMGVVYAAHDPELDRRVAIKVLRHDPRDVDGGTERRARMQREAQSLARVSHENVITVYDVGAYGDQVFIAMELVDGWTLRRWLGDAPRDWQAVTRAYLAAARGLAEAHAVGVVHRDFKPDNVLMWRDGHVQVTDFGLARIGGPLASGGGKPTGDEETLTQTGTVMGTPAYMAPEQHAGDVVGEAADQWSFCVALYEGLYGERPFAGRSLDELGDAVRRGELRSPPRGRRVPAALRALILRGLARRPQDRHPSMIALIAGLEDALRPRQRWPWLAGAAAAAALAVAGALVMPRATPGPGGEVGARPGVAVLPVRNGAGRPELDWVSVSLPEMLSTELSAGDKLRSVPAETIRRVQKGEPDAAELARELGARYLITGSFVPAGDRIRVDLRLEEPGGAGVLVAYGETVSEAGLVELATRAGARFRTRLRVPDLSTDEEARLRTTLPASSEAARSYAEALELMRTGDETGALPLLERATTQDPRFAVGQAALATALWDLGYGERARTVAAIARTLARDLPREERLTVEARCAQAEGDAAHLIAVLDERYRAFPDRHDYGIELLGAVANDHRNAEATALLGRLRAVGPPTSDDLELDRVELYVAVDVGDLDRVPGLAARLAERARVDDNVPLLTDALFNQGAALWYRGQLEAARQAFLELIAAQNRIDDPGGQATALRMLALVRRDQGHLAEARAGLEQALELDRKTGNARNPTAPVAIAQVLAAQGDLAAAERLRASVSLEATGAAPGHAEIALLAGDLAAARTRCDATLEKLTETPFFHARALLLRARIRQAAGDAAGARADYELARTLATPPRHEVTLARVELGLAGLDVDEGRPPSDRLRAARPVFEREDLVAELAWSAALAGDGAEARRLAPRVEDVPLRDLILTTVATDAAAVEEIRRRAAAGGYAVLELEARLALVRLGHGDARAIARDAAARGLGRIAALAGRR